MRFSFTISVFLLSFLSISKGYAIHTEPESVRDTATAVVVYNADARFLPQANYGVKEYTRMIDSLVVLDTVPVSLVNQLSVYRMLADKNAGELELVIDSIFDMENVPQPVLNAVNIYMTTMEDALAQPTGLYAYVPESTAPHPSDYFYKDWNTEVPNPYRNNLSKFDSTLKLMLVDSAQNCGYYPPFEGVVTSHFGWRYGRNHNGIDIDLEVWDPVHSAFAGVVRVAKYYQGFGRVVVVRHYNGLETLYAHLHRFKVRPGDIIEAGDVVGLGGSSGHSTGSHLHFEVRFQGVPIKPSSLIDFKSNKIRTNVVALQKSGAFLAVAADNETGVKKVYVVKQGDYLYKIAEKFGTSVDKICTLNNIQSKSSLVTGQKLIIGT
ncbi:peptidoglycan DD-metalloendopeptidase family protein [Cryomorpha ignava]|uniref:Peptidoglycan DD-metalloendopeptidase family protein n=1 Tax=Cryomorpha ignava TaxID=101383 RepID=A0A7K3WQ49_9FLAO|nr:M23 family metallopeptidase [Cryomorpha ignava]NEN23608.1 peptidoglycan DD-metalloendopeptidase family protein [Cryomorpha ignava]